MKVLMFPISGALGATQCLVKIAEHLRCHGHDVTFAGQDTFMPFIAQQGFATVPIVELDHAAYRRRLNRGSLGVHTADSIRHFVAAELSSFAELQPDVVVDVHRPTLHISAKIAGIPRVHIANSVLTKYYREHLAVPESHWASPLLRVKGLNRIVQAASPAVKEGMYRVWLRPYNTVLAASGLPTARHFLDLCDGDHTVLMDAAEFAPITAAPPTVHQVGPILHDITDSAPPWIGEIGRNGATVIYVSMGSTGTLLSRIIADLDALYGGRADVQIVTNTTMMQVGAMPASPNIYVADLLPAGAILPRSNVVITHGGRGTIYHALLHGTPIVGVPDQAEQEWNLDRVAELGLGLRLSKKRYSRPLLQTALDVVLADGAYRRRAQEFSQRLARYHGPEDAARIIAGAARSARVPAPV